MLSALFAASRIGLPLLRSSCATSASPGFGPVAASTTRMMRSAFVTAIRAWSCTATSITSPCAGCIPPVSTRRNLNPFHSAIEINRSRVVPARSSTTARRSPTKRLKSVLFPTFGRPTSATSGRRSCTTSSSGPWRRLIGRSVQRLRWFGTAVSPRRRGPLVRSRVLSPSRTQFQPTRQFARQPVQDPRLAYLFRRSRRLG